MNKSLWKRLNMNELNMTQNYCFYKCATALFENGVLCCKTTGNQYWNLVEIACLTSK